MSFILAACVGNSGGPCSVFDHTGINAGCRMFINDPEEMIWVTNNLNASEFGSSLIPIPLGR